MAFCFHVYAAVGEGTVLVEWGSKILGCRLFFLKGNCNLAPKRDQILFCFMHLAKHLVLFFHGLEDL